VPGIIRAHHDEDEEVAAAAVAPVLPTPPPLFSNEGSVRKAGRTGWKARIAGPVSGIAAASAAAGSALGHSAGSRGAEGEAPGGAVAEQAIAEPVVAEQAVRGHGSGLLGRLADTRAFTAVASVALAIRVAVVWVGSAVAVVVLPIVLGLARLVAIPVRPVADWISSRDSTWPDFDEFGNPRPAGGPRRRAMGAMLFAGFFGVLFLGIALMWVLPQPGPNNNSSAPPTHGGNVALASAPNGNNGNNGNPAIDPTPDPSAVLVGDESLAPGATRRPATPKPPVITPAPTPAPTQVPTPTQAPTNTATASPTNRPTPVPTATPATPVIDTEEVSPVVTGVQIHVHVFYFPQSTCYLTRAIGSSKVNSKTFLVWDNGDSGGVLVPPTSSSKLLGIYTITATCTAPGSAVKITSPPITFEWTPAPSPSPTASRTPTLSPSPT
jgi:hypothetical protein